MTTEVKKTEFIEVPFSCPLPALCPICCSRGEKRFRITASEGIPLVHTYSLAIRILYCRAHHKQLRVLQICQWLAIFGFILAPFFALLPALGNWSLRWLFYGGLVIAVACLYFAVSYSRKLRWLRSVQMRTMGNQRSYLLRGVQPEWNDALARIVDDYKKKRQPGPAGFMG